MIFKTLILYFCYYWSKSYKVTTHFKISLNVAKLPLFYSPNCSFCLSCFLLLVVHKTSPVVYNMNGLSLPGVAAFSLCLEGRSSAATQTGATTKVYSSLWGQKTGRCKRRMIGFILDLEDCIARCMWSMAEHWRAGRALPGQGRAFLTVLYFEFTRTWHMPKIVWSQQPAYTRSAVMGDRGPLSAAEAVCLCHECMPKT